MAVDNCTRVCANCEAQFKRDRKGQSTKYCQKCCEEAGTCNHCGKIVKATPSSPKKFCSRACHAKHKTVRVKSITCRYCKETKKRVVRKTGDAGLYCSDKCARKDRKERSIKRKAKLKEVKAESKALRSIAVKVRAWARRQDICLNCLKKYTKARYQRYCTELCRQEAEALVREAYKKSERGRELKAAYKAKRRALKATTSVEAVNPYEVFKRDSWLCHLCGLKTKKSLRGTSEDLAPELEHIVPLSKGGTHTLDNVACSCRKCNLSKGSKTVGQLGLPLHQ